MFLPSNITLKFGDSGDFVSELQRRLSVANCFDEAGINGFYDGVTVNGVSQFQSISGIRADGIAGPETLRRLNGAISGDYSGSSPDELEAKRREEQAQALLLQQRQYAYMEEQALLEQQQQERAYQQQMQQQMAVKPEVLVQPVPQSQFQPPQQAQGFTSPAPQPLAAAQIAMMDQLQQQQGIQSNPLSQQTPLAGIAQQHSPQQAASRAVAPSAADVLAQMLLATPQPQAAQQQAHAQPSATQAAPAPAQATAIPIAAASQQQIAPASPTAGTQPAQAAPEQPRGMVGRAANYASQVVQKLAGYFEEKLPNHVINEVKEIGLTMSKSGIKEAAMPAGMEPQRAPDAPARTQQPQTIQRG